MFWRLDLFVVRCEEEKVPVQLSLLEMTSLGHTTRTRARTTYSSDGFNKLWTPVLSQKFHFQIYLFCFLLLCKFSYVGIGLKHSCMFLWNIGNHLPDCNLSSNQQHLKKDVVTGFWITEIYSVSRIPSSVFLCLSIFIMFI